MKFRLSYIIVFLATIMSYGQVFLSSEANVKESTVNDSFTVTFVMEINGEDYVQESRMKLPDLEKFNVLGSGSEQKTFIDPISKLRVNQIVYQVLLQPKQAGNLKVGSALVKVNGKMYKSEPFDIQVKEFGKKVQDITSSNDVYLSVKLEDKEVYKNEPVVAILRAYSRDFDNFRKIKNIHAQPQSNVIVHAVNYNRSDIEPGGRNDYASQIIAVFVVFPKEDGDLELPSFVAEFSDGKMSKLVSNRANVHVKKLPPGAPDDFSYFVGNFSLNISDSESLPQSIEINKPIDIVLKMVGKGNMTAAKMPKILETEDYSVFPPKFVKNVKIEKKGIVGEIEAHYVVVPKKTGKIAIKTEAFSFFNPDTKVYKDLGVQSTVINALTPEQIASNKTTLQKVNEYTNNVLETVSTPVIQTKNLTIEPNKKINWWVIVGNLTLVSVLSFLFLLMRRRMQRRNEAILVNNQPKAPLLNIEETEALLKSNKHIDINVHLAYLENIIAQKRYNEFFKAFAEMHDEVDKVLSNTENKNLKDYFKNYDYEIFRNYEKLCHIIEVERYAPLHSEEEMQRISKLSYKVFSKIEN